MNEAITIGLDLAKSVFQVHGFDAGGGTVIRRQLRRRYVPRGGLDVFRGLGEGPGLETDPVLV